MGEGADTTYSLNSLLKRRVWLGKGGDSLNLILKPWVCLENEMKAGSSSIFKGWHGRRSSRQLPPKPSIQAADLAEQQEVPVDRDGPLKLLSLIHI